VASVQSDRVAAGIVGSLKADIVSWGVVFIGVALTVYAYHRIYDLVAEREAAKERGAERDEQIDEYRIRPNRSR